MQICRWLGAPLAAVAWAACTPMTVQTLSGQGGQPVPGVQVQVGDSAWVTTDDQGRATFFRAEPPFVVRVHQVTEQQGPGGARYQNDLVWQLQNLEGDPVLLVSSVSVPSFSTVISGSITGISSLGSASVYASGDPYRIMWPWGSSFTFSVEWERPGPLDSVLRAIETEGSGTAEHYVGYGEVPVTLNHDQRMIGVSVPLGPLSEGTVDVTVAPPPELSGRSFNVTTSLRFPGSGRLLLGQYGSSEQFSVQMPQIPGGEPWVAVESSGDRGLYRHDRKVSVPASGVILDLPEAVSLVEPADGAAIDASTVFRWTGGPAGGQAMAQLSCSWKDASGVNRVAVQHLEVAGTESAWLDVPGLTVDPGAQCTWTVDWSPLGQHHLATQADAEAAEHVSSTSVWRKATFQ